MSGSYVLVKMSAVFPAFTGAALDLLGEVEQADEALIPATVRQAAEALRSIVQEWEGEL